MAHVVPVQADDRQELSGFLCAFPEEPREQDFWSDRLRSWWEGNPAFSEEVPRGWLLRDEGRIVGFLGNIPSRFQVGAQERIVWNATTWRVLPDYRAQSMALVFRQMAECRNALLFDTTPTENVVQILRAMRFEALRCGTGWASALVVNWRRVAEAKWPSIPGIGATAGAAGRWLGRLQAGRLRRKTGRGGAVVREASRVDGSFDDLWRKTRHHHPHTNVRTSEAIRWYCFVNRSCEKILLASYEAGRLLGYGICRASEEGRLRRIEFLDLWVDPGEAGVVGSLIEAAAEHARGRSMDLVVLPHYTEWAARELSGAGLARLSWRFDRYYVKGPPDLLAPLRERRAYLVGAQGDVGL